MPFLLKACGCKFIQLPPALTQLRSTKPVIAVCATRTGTGKSQTTRFIANYLKREGKKIAVIRHPMPYDQVLLDQRCQRYAELEDLVKYKCTIEEREEYELHIEEGNLLFAGVDYERIIREAEKEADIILWDGGNNDFSFYRPDLTICVADALRGGHEEHFYPGEINIRMADIIIINKVNSLPSVGQAKEQSERIRALIKTDTPILFGNSIVSPEALDKSTREFLDEKDVDNLVRGKRVLVIDDGPTLTHGGMPFGAGFVLAKQMNAKEIVDPHSSAKGSIQEVLKKFQHLGRVLPAMGYGEEQIRDLQDTVQSVDCDCVIIGTPINLENVIEMTKPCVRARYCLELDTGNMDAMKQKLRPFVSH